MSDHKKQRKHLQDLLEKIDQNSRHKFMDSLEVKYSKEKKSFRIFNEKQGIYITHRMSFEQMVYYLAGFERALDFVHFEQKNMGSMWRSATPRRRHRTCCWEWRDGMVPKRIRGVWFCEWWWLLFWARQKECNVIEKWYIGSHTIKC